MYIISLKINYFYDFILIKGSICIFVYIDSKNIILK